MKLRFRQNSIRLRMNRREVEQLAGGKTLREVVQFPGTRLTYVLEPSARTSPEATLEENIIRVSAPESAVKTWAISHEIGMYYELPTTEAPLKIAIEKDLECLDGPDDERDPLAFARDPGSIC